MITNPQVIKNKYQCNKRLAYYLIYQKHLPLLGIDGHRYYFTDNQELRDILGDLSLWWKFVKMF